MIDQSFKSVKRTDAKSASSRIRLPRIVISRIKRSPAKSLRWTSARVGRLVIAIAVVTLGNPFVMADDRAHSDSNARYVHHIDLYDLDNRRIGPESTKPYSTRNTCGRCHDYETIAGGWHFNALDRQKAVSDGRTGEPWIWTDPRTGTTLPLSYRDWPDRFNPDDVGLTAFEMTRHFGARLPGGGVGQPDQDAIDAEGSRWPFSGPLEIDCMICHAVDGGYDFNLRREHIEEENFAWAPTAGLRLGTIKGSVDRIKDGSSLEDESTQKKMPSVTYQASIFGLDDKVHIDLVRSPSNNACYQCHSRRQVDENGIEKRWLHDEDIHIIAGMNCTDCHRNGIGHHTVRGFEGEQHPMASVETLSCAGCHLGSDAVGHRPDDDALAIRQRHGRMGSPYPLHKGIPPIHFEQMSCTSCHGGIVPESSAGGLLTSLAHVLGSAEHRSGFEMPEIRSPIYADAVRHAAATTDRSTSMTSDGRTQPDQTKTESAYAASVEHPRKTSPQNITWASFFGYIDGDRVHPLHPEKVYAETRRSLRVRKDIIDELVQPDADNPDEALAEYREKMAAALTAIGKAFDVTRPVYVAGGSILGLLPETPGSDASLMELDADEFQLATGPAATGPAATVQGANGHDATAADSSIGIGAIRWPIAHNVRGAGQSLGSQGCLECHVDDGLIFASTVSVAGPTPANYRGGLRDDAAVDGTIQTDDEKPITMAALRGVDESQRLLWNGLFGGRKAFKYLTGASLLATVMVGILAVFQRHEKRMSRGHDD